MQDRTAAFPRARTLVHPGPSNAVRIDHMSDVRGRHFRLSLPSGETIHDSLVRALAQEGVTSASMTLLGGDLQDLGFCLAQPDPSGRRVAMYGPPHSESQARLIFGNATLGKTADGAPTVHCHAAFRTADGTVRGGHILTDRTRVGREPITVVVNALDSFELRIGFDEETCMPLMRPHKRSTDVRTV